MARNMGKTSITTLQAIILAAGEGTRMKSEVSKVLHSICGRPMIAYMLDLVAAAGVTRPIVVIGHGSDVVKGHLPKEAKAVIQPKRLGTGDAVLMAKRALETTVGDLLILYADVPLVRRATIQRLIEAHRKANATCTLLTAHLADPAGYGRIIRNEQGVISGIMEESELHAPQRTIREINVGPLIVKTQALLDALAEVKTTASTKELYLTHAVAQMSRQEHSKILSTRVEEATEALGINTRAELARAIGVIRQRIVDSHLHNGVTIEDVHSTFIDHGVTIGADTVVHPYTVIETGVSIGKRCSIGPFARLRKGVTVGSDTRIGNFVELVRAKIGSEVRINHVSYLGDAVVEDSVNIGAGTMTANYDGQQKHPTHIGKGAFIGCDTVLIAPVKVGPGAITGAGSVIPKTHDVPPRSIVVGVPARLMDGLKASEETLASVKKVKEPKAAGAASASAKTDSAKTKRSADRNPISVRRSSTQRMAKSVKARLSKRLIASKTTARRR